MHILSLQIAGWKVSCTEDEQFRDRHPSAVSTVAWRVAARKSSSSSEGPLGAQARGVTAVKAKTVGCQVGLQAAESGPSQLAGSDAVCRRALGKSAEIDVVVTIFRGVADFGQYCQAMGEGYKEEIEAKAFIGFYHANCDFGTAVLCA